MAIGLEIVVLFLLVFLNGAFAMSELAIVSARRGRLLAMQRTGSLGAAAAIALAEDPQRFLPTGQAGVTLVGIAAGGAGGGRPARRRRAAAPPRPAAPQRFLPTVQVGIPLVGILAGVFGGARLAGPLGSLL